MRKEPDYKQIARDTSRKLRLLQIRLANFEYWAHYIGGWILGITAAVFIILAVLVDLAALSTAYRYAIGISFFCPTIIGIFLKMV